MVLDKYLKLREPTLSFNLIILLTKVLLYKLYKFKIYKKVIINTLNKIY